MSEITTEQDNKKEQPLDTTQNKKNRKALEPASSDLPALLVILAVVLVGFIAMIIRQNVPTATTSKSQQSAKASASACPDGYMFGSNIYSAKDFIKGTIDNGDNLLVVGWLAHADWYRNTADLCMDAACQGPSITLFLNPDNPSLFHQKYAQHRTMSNWTVLIAIRNGEVKNLWTQYDGDKRLWTRNGEHGICYLAE